MEDLQSPVAVPNDQLLITIKEAARMLSLSRSFFYELLDTEQIASIKIGHLRRIPVSALHTFIDRQLGQGR